jgi:hypothetical protein
MSSLGECGQNLLGPIHQIKVGTTAGQLGEQRAGAVTGEETESDDTLVVNLFRRLDPGTLDVGAEELTERRRGRWIGHAAGHQMQPGRFGVSGQVQDQGLAGNTDFQGDDVLRRLVDFLNPPAGQGWRELPHDRGNFLEG